MQLDAKYPTAEHKKASETIVGFFSESPAVEAVILTGSCARGKATPDSCLDILVLMLPEVFSTEKAGLEQRWSRFYKNEDIFRALRQVGRYSHVDMEFTDGYFVPRSRDWTSGPDEFELEIGNTLVYTVPLWERRDYLERLGTQWLPYYSDTLRRSRLTMVRRYLLNNLDHASLYANRDLHFQAFKRLYDAFQEFLQALFISRRTYPIAYDKWIREQIEGILELPQLYQQLPKLFKIEHFENLEIANKAKDLTHLFEVYVAHQGP